MTTEFSARLPRMPNEPYKGGLFAFLRDEMLAEEWDLGSRPVPGFLKPILDIPMRVGGQFFHLTPDGPVLLEITEDGCKEVTDDI